MSKQTSQPAPELRKSKIGGQALIEGIMMKGPRITAMACRLPNGEIETETWSLRCRPDGKPFWYQRIPLIRGCYNMVSSLIDGYRYTMMSSEKQFTIEPDANEKSSKLEAWLEEHLGDHLAEAVILVTIMISVFLIASLFLVFPRWLVGLIRPLIERRVLRSAAEGIVKALVFVGYLSLTNLMKDMRRVYQYHGAEHKTIACHEAGLPLTVENVRKQCRFHPRCGTSFIFITVIIGIIAGCFIPFVVTWQRICASLLMLPLVVGISYECIRFAGKHDNPLTRILSAPGLWLQRITTREPDDAVIEVAIAAIKPCIPENPEEDQW